MKTTVKIFLIIILFTRCGKIDSFSDLNKENKCKINFTSFELYAGDTINLIDKNGLKQGIWHEGKYVNINKFIPPVYIVKSIGFFKNNNKVGCWKNYDNNGNIIDSLNL